MINENEIQIEPERIIERLKRIEFRLSQKNQEGKDGKDVEACPLTS